VIATEQDERIRIDPTTTICGAIPSPQLSEHKGHLRGGTPLSDAPGKLGSVGEGRVLPSSRRAVDDVPKGFAGARIDRSSGAMSNMSNAAAAGSLVALADRIELWPIEKLRPYERNPRTHSEAQVDQLAASMVEFGWTNPVLVDEQGGILAGHGRLLAARKLGLAEVPVIRFEHLSEAQKRAYLIADNQLALQAGWSEELLAEELAWLRDESFDLDLIGFDASELERLLALADGEAASDEAEDEVPEPPEDPVSKPGDLWILGKHRLLCGDATVLADVERVLGGQLADMTFCDPPYNVDYANSPKDKLRSKHRPILNDDLGSGFEAFLYEACVKPRCPLPWLAGFVGRGRTG
jgi:ParB-like nuclease domain